MKERKKERKKKRQTEMIEQRSMHTPIQDKKDKRGNNEVRHLKQAKMPTQTVAHAIWFPPLYSLDPLAS